MDKREREYTIGEEIANALSHGLGALLSLVGLVVLVRAAALDGDAWRVVSASVYGASLMVLYLGSTLYHGLPESRAKKVFKILDHASIFILIAGTYTPFSLVTLRGPWGWSLFGVIWGLATLGIVLKALIGDRYGFLFGLLYVAMGWLAVIALKPLMATLPPAGFRLVLLGGLTYTAGVLFYAIDRIPWNHAIWHLFVLGGSLLHYWAVLRYVIA